jgi:hypothetical protein
LHTIGFKPVINDTSLFIYKNGDELAYLLLYVDNIVLTASSTSLLQRITTHLGATFALKDLGPLHFFLASKCSARHPGSFFIRPSTPMTYLIAPGWSIASQRQRRSTPAPSRPQPMARLHQISRSTAT